jgi:hypothetical protein
VVMGGRYLPSIRTILCLTEESGGTSCAKSKAKLHIALRAKMLIYHG